MLTGSSVTFHGGVILLVKILGCQLEELYLSEVPSLQAAQMDLLLQCCQNLRYLSLGIISKDDSPNEIAQQRPFNPPHATTLCFLPLQFLEDLSLTSSEFPNQMFFVPPQMLLSLLSSPKLKSVDIYNCETLSDEILEQANAFRCFQHFKDLYLSVLSNCPNVSQKGIGVFMVENNMLNQLSLIGRVGIDSKSIEDWEIMAKQKN